MGAIDGLRHGRSSGQRDPDAVVYGIETKGQWVATRWQPGGYAYWHWCAELLPKLVDRKSTAVDRHIDLGDNPPSSVKDCVV